MSSWFDGNAWWSHPVLLALEVLVIVAIAAVVHRRLKSAAWQRTVWQACLVTVALLALAEWSGVHHTLNASRPSPAERGRPVQPLPPPIPAAPESSKVQAEPITTTVVSATPHPVPVHFNAPDFPNRSRQVKAPVIGTATTETQNLRAWWLLVWLIGCLGMLSRGAMLHLAFAWWRRRARTVTDPALIRLLLGLQRRLGSQQKVHLIESPRFHGPVAFGLLRPTIGLPPRFAIEHDIARQEVMLAHELAHLAARDPVWHQVADVTAALLWWHPAVWWARRQLRNASELAADEASAIIAGGPAVLAQCLVELGARLTRTPALVGSGIDGAFRSGLGRRVQRLVTLPHSKWTPPGGGAVSLTRMAAPAIVATTLLAGVAWSFPETSNQGARMKHWQEALSLLALSTTLSTAQVAAPAQPPAVPTPPAPVAPMAPVAPVAPAAPSSRVDSKPDHRLQPPVGHDPFASSPRPVITGLTGAEALQEKLKQIRLAEVSYDALPLSDVIQSLIRESAALDPAKRGVNFLFGQDRTPATPYIDPATGLPVTPASNTDFDLRSVSIVINPPLKNVRLMDILDAIVKVADVPIKYSVEEYAVVFTRHSGAAQPAAANQVFATPATPPPTVPAAPAPAAPSQTRTFKVDAKKFFPSLERMFGVAVDPDSKDAGGKIQLVLHAKAGVRPGSPDSLMLYNPLTGVLLIRGSVEELEALQALVEMLGGTATKGAEAKSSTSSAFLKHLAEGPHVHVHRAVTGMFGAISELAPPPFRRSSPEP